MADKIAPADAIPVTTLRYLIISATTTDELASTISKYVINGWQPVGGVYWRTTHGITRLYQAVWLALK